MTRSLAPLECPDAVCFVFLPSPVQRTERFALQYAWPLLTYTYELMPAFILKCYQKNEFFVQCCCLIFFLRWSYSAPVCIGAFRDLGKGKAKRWLLCEGPNCSLSQKEVCKKEVTSAQLPVRGFAPCLVLQMPVRKISLEVSALLIPFTETKFQEANRAESAKDEMLEIKLMKLNHQFAT